MSIRSSIISALVFSIASLGSAADERTATPDSSTVSLVPFSHLDLFWGGTQEECLSRGNRIITRVIRLATQHPEFRFLLEDEVFIANYVETHLDTPDLKQLKRLVTEGRIEISPKWAAIHQNTPRAEALVRNIVYGKQYARDVFGVDPLTANLGDLPAYTSQFPQIMARSRVPYAVMTRMGPSDKSLFYWKALDGSRALTWNTLKGYGWGTFLTSKTLSPEEKRARFQKDLTDLRPTTSGPILMNWGTDLWAPPENLVNEIASFNESSPARLVFSTATDYFHRAEKTKTIPEASGEIPYAWWNMLTSIIHMWPPAMSAADTLVTAEKFAAINYALGYANYPQQEFDTLWKKVLEAFDHNNFGQGGFLGDARKLEYAQLASIRGGEILTQSLRNIAERVRSPYPRSMPIVVFNPLGWNRDDSVKAHVSLYGDSAPGDIPDYKKGMRVVDEAGASVPFHVEATGATVSKSLELIFVARGVPALGYKTYFVIPAEKADQLPNATELKLDDRQQRTLGSDQMENQYYRVTVDRATGRVSVFDKELDRFVAKDMEITAREERAGNTLNLQVLTGRVLNNSVSGVEVEEHNPVRTVLRIDGTVGGVNVTQRVSLYRGLKRVDLENTVDWKQEKLMQIEQLFPYEHPDAKIEYGVPFGAVGGSDVMPNSKPRSTDEVSKEVWDKWRQIQDWIFAGSTEWGLTIAADRQVMILGDNVIRAGMLRGTYQAAAVTRDGKPYIMQVPPSGKYLFHYSLSSNKGDWKAAKAYRSGMALNVPLLFFSPADDLSAKSLPPSQGFVSLGSENLVISAVKKAEKQPAVVIRVFEAEGLSADTSIEFLGSKKSFREVNLLEEDLRAGDQQTLRVRPFEIRTLKLAPK